MIETGKFITIAGLMLVLLGIMLTFSNQIPFLGKLPGDIYIKNDKVTFFFPLTTSILLSLAVSLLIKIFNK